MRAPREFLNFLRSGDLFDAAFSDGDRDLLMAFRDGLERWTASHLFPEVSERVFICEYAPSTHLFSIVSSHQSFHNQAGTSRLAPIAYSTVLLPSTANEIEVIHLNRQESIELVIHLKPEADKANLSTLGDEPELDLYCAADSADVLYAFQTLSQAMWPRKLSLSKGSPDVWPKTGLRDVYAPSEAALASGALPLLSLIRHVGDERFIRLPLRELHAGLVKCEDGCEYRIKVTVGDCARKLADTLRDKIKINHLPMWNRYFGQIDSKGMMTLDQEARVVRASVDRGRPLLILECSDGAARQHYADRRWSRWIDPVRTFDFRPGKAKDLELKFSGKIPEDLRLVYLAEDFCGKRDEVIGKELAHDSVKLLAREELYAGDEPSLSLAWWLARGYVFPPLARIHTREQLLQLVRDLLPAPVKALEPAIDISTVLRPRPPGNISSGRTPLFALPAIVITLSSKRHARMASLAYYCEWLSRRLTVMCPPGMIVHVEIS